MGDLRKSEDGFPVEGKMEEIYSKYQITDHRGFLPASDPLEDLPEQYVRWNEPRTIRELLLSGKMRDRVLELPELEIPKDEKWEVLIRLHSLLALISHAYIVGNCLKPENLLHEIPQNIAKPFVEVSNRLGHAPILTDADIVFWNWRRKDKTKEDLSTENLELMIGFLKSKSEDWFYLITTELEWRGAVVFRPIFNMILSSHQFGENKITPEQFAEVLEVNLNKLKGGIQIILETLKKMLDGCIPETFYMEVRPYVSGWEKGSKNHPDGMVYGGCFNNEPQHYYGASAAQSPLIQLLDAFFNVEHETTYLVEMRKYMPLLHSYLVNDVYSLKHKVRDFMSSEKVKQFPKVEELWKECVSILREFRSYHIRIASQYIIQQAAKLKKAHAPESEENIRGTGGTVLIAFLKSVRDETQ